MEVTSNPVQPVHGAGYPLPLRGTRIPTDGTQKSLPRGAWTDAADPDPFVEMALGRSPFRVEDLGALVDLMGRLLADPRAEGL